MSVIVCRNFSPDFLPDYREYRRRCRRALRRDERFPDAAIGRSGLTFDKAEALQFGDLPADRGVVAPNSAGEIDDPDWAAPLDDDKQGEQGAIERNAGFPDHHLIKLGTVDDTDDVDQRPM